MICKGSQRAGGLDLALHLLNDRDNDHIEVHEIRGTAAQDLTGALLEIEASMACTKAEQAFFSVQLSPPKGSEIEHDTAAYERAAALIEKKYPDLANQPRVIVFHEKEGRRHGHAVWSRIDTERMKAVDLSLFKLKLGDVSRAMFREYGLEMPAGYEDSRKADPCNYGLTMWQQCKRIGEDPRDLKRIVQEAFQHSDSRKAFAAALEGHALMLARGDRRGFVVVHHSGEAIGLKQCLPDKMRIKDMRERLGHENECITVDQAQSQLRARMTATAEKQVDDLKRQHAQESTPHREAVLELRTEQRAERQNLKEVQEARTAQEALIRGQRLRKGLMGWWDRFTGQHGRVTKQNREEAEAARERDRKQAEEQIKAQLEDRRQIQEQIDTLNARQTSERNQARAVLGYWLSLDKDSARHALQQHTDEIDQQKDEWKERQRGTSGLFKAASTEEGRKAEEASRRNRKEREARFAKDKGGIEHEM